MKKLLVFQHLRREHPSRIHTYALTHGVKLEVVRLWEPFVMPDVSTYDALIVLGGPKSAYEDFPGKEVELAVLSEVVGHMPVLGICLGGQLLAQALGAEVRQHVVDGVPLKEVGHYTISLTTEGKRSPLFRNMPEQFTMLQWHGDTFDIPEGAVHIAEGEKCRNQAFSYKNAYGVQFHFEHTPYALAHQVDQFGDWARTGFNFDEKKVLEEAFARDKEMTEHCYQLMDNFLS